MGLSAVFFDVGNTLLFERPSRPEIYSRAAASRGVEVSTSKMGHLMRSVHSELRREIDGAFRYSDPWFAIYIEHVYCRGLGISHEALPGLRDELFSRFSDPATFRLFPGTLDLLGRARELGLCIGLVSNWSTRLPALLRGLDLERHIDFVLCSATERVEKPEALMFERALSRANSRPGETLHAGDHPLKDCAGARAAGIQTVLVDHFDEHMDKQEFTRVTSLDKLKEHIERLA